MSGEADFIDAIATAGLEPPTHIVPDGKLHRFSSNGKRGDLAGWYVYHDGEHPGGMFGCWRLGISETWSARRRGPIPRAERRALAEAARQRNKEAAQRERDEREATRTLAQHVWELATPAPANHPYLVAKGVQPHGIGLLGCEFKHAPRHVRGAGNLLVIPACDIYGKVWWVQFVNERGTKGYLAGRKERGCFYLIGTPDELVYVCEGFATGASLHEATGSAVLVGFDTAGLPGAAESARLLAPQARVIIAADDDPAGIKAAMQAADRIGAEILRPSFDGLPRGPRDSDFNDLLRLRGAHAR